MMNHRMMKFIESDRRDKNTAATPTATIERTNIVAIARFPSDSVVPIPTSLNSSNEGAYLLFVVDVIEFVCLGSELVA